MSKELTTTFSQDAVVTYPDAAFTSLVEIRSNPSKYPRIGHTDITLACTMMRAIIYKAHVYSGRVVSKEDADLMSRIMVSELISDNELKTATLSWVEIDRAITRGVIGCGREMYGINVASMMMQIMDYCKGEGHEADKKASVAKSGTRRGV